MLTLISTSASSVGAGWVKRNDCYFSIIKALSQYNISYFMLIFANRFYNMHCPDHFIPCNETYTYNIDVAVNKTTTGMLTLKKIFQGYSLPHKSL